ncbi:MAG: hypothetical protein QXT14_08925 [Candidatus Bathyarchaeia archaeon]
MSYKIRVNSKSKEIAAFTKAYLERKLNYPFDIAMSTKTFLFLDVDYKNFEWCYGIASQLAQHFKCKCILIETPNGYHIVVLKRFEWSELVGWIKLFISESDALYLDKAHLEASLRRGYMTLRMNGLKFYEVDEYGKFRVLRESK